MIWFQRFGELPIDLHSHFTCGLASTTYWEAAKAGVDIIDTAISPFAHATSQPATETMIEMFKGTEWDLGRLGLPSIGNSNIPNRWYNGYDERYDGRPLQNGS